MAEQQPYSRTDDLDQPRPVGPGERGRKARQRDRDAIERDAEADRRDFRDDLRDNLMNDHPGGEERALAKNARDHARTDREAAAQDRERAAHDRQAMDFVMRGQRTD